MPSAHKSKTKKRSLLSRTDRETLLALLIRNEAVFEAFNSQLKFEHWVDVDIASAIVWRTVKDLYAEHQSLPSRKLLKVTLESVADEAVEDSLLQSDETDDLFILLEMAFDRDSWPKAIATNAQFTKLGLELGRKFLEERMAVELQNTIKQDGRIVSDLPQILQTYVDQAQQLQSLHSGGPSKIFDDDWDKNGGLQIFTTGSDYLDELLGGGQAPAEVYGFMGPHGSCKTTQGVKLLVDGAHSARQLELSPAWDGVRRYAVYVTYEAPLKNELRIRILSYAARIERSSLESMGSEGLKTLSRTGALKPYEEALYEKGLLVPINGKKLGEYERAQAAMKLIEQHCLILDMTGTDKAWSSAGGDGVPEIVSRLKRELRSRHPELKDHSKCVRVGVVDYVLALCRKYMSRHELDQHAFRLHVSGVPMELKQMLAGPFESPWWAFHQLNGEGNAKSTTAELKSTDAAESKTFAENLDFCFIVSKPNKQNLAVLRTTKTRRTGPKPEQIIRILGHMSTVIATGDQYQISPSGNAIVSKADAHATGSVSQTSALQQQIAGMLGGEFEDEMETVGAATLETED